MPVLFPKTVRSLSGTSGKHRLVLLVLALMLLSAWTAWALLGSISIVAVSNRGRLETRQALHQLAAPAAGTVAIANATLGRAVRRGDVLLEMDTRDARIEQSRLDTEVRSLEQRMRALDAQLAATTTLAAAEMRSAESGRTQAAEETAQARELAQIDAARARQAMQLARDGLVSQSDADEAARRAAAAEAHVRSLLAAEEEAERAAEHAAAAVELRRRELESERIEINQELQSGVNSLRAADLRIERMRVRAPADGRIIRSSEPKPGQWMTAGERICSIAPNARMEVAAWFPLEEMPMITPGQKASIWVNVRGAHDRVRARASVIAVEHDAAAAEEFLVRLTLDESEGRVEALRQGYPAVAAVEILSVTPLRALLRVAGMVRD